MVVVVYFPVIYSNVSRAATPTPTPTHHLPLTTTYLHQPRLLQPHTFDLFTTTPHHTSPPPLHLFLFLPHPPQVSPPDPPSPSLPLLNDNCLRCSSSSSSNPIATGPPSLLARKHPQSLAARVSWIFGQFPHSRSHILSISNLCAVALD